MPALPALRPLLLLLALLAAAPALAQVPEDAMELQRCIWRCLNGSPGAKSAEYQACIAGTCAAGVPDVVAATPPAPSYARLTWTLAATADGRGRSAYAHDTSLDTVLHAMCGPDGTRYLALFGPEGPDAELSVLLGPATRRLAFVNDSGGVYAAIPAGAEVWAEFLAAPTIAILNDAGWPLFSARLDAAAHAAIGTACP